VPQAFKWLWKTSVQKRHKVFFCCYLRIGWAQEIFFGTEIKLYRHMSVFSAICMLRKHWSIFFYTAILRKLLDIFKLAPYCWWPFWCPQFISSAT
jgi:hypothetical protein